MDVVIGDIIYLFIYLFIYVIKNSNVLSSLYNLRDLGREINALIVGFAIHKFNCKNYAVYSERCTST